MYYFGDVPSVIKTNKYQTFGGHEEFDAPFISLFIHISFYMSLLGTLRNSCTFSRICCLLYVVLVLWLWVWPICSVTNLMIYDFSVMLISIKWLNEDPQYNNALVGCVVCHSAGAKLFLTDVSLLNAQYTGYRYGWREVSLRPRGHNLETMYHHMKQFTNNYHFLCCQFTEKYPHVLTIRNTISIHQYHV